jgi:hypothetical protein
MRDGSRIAGLLQQDFLTTINQGRWVYSIFWAHCSDQLNSKG